MGVATTTKTWPAVKDPDDYKDYGIDWTKTILTDAIVSSTWSVASGGSDLILDQQSIASPLTITWINGGSADADYEVRNSIVTAAGRKFDRTVKLRVKDQ